MKKFAVEMKNVVNKMFGQRPKALVGDHIFLAAAVAKTAGHLCTTVQAIFLPAFGLMAHVKKFLKNRDKTHSSRIIGTASAPQVLFLAQTDQG